MMIAGPERENPLPLKDRHAIGKALSTLAFLGTLLLSACASEEPPPPPTMVMAKVSAVESLNPNAESRPSPLVVRLYELTEESPFATADFFDIYDNDQATLGATLVATDEFKILPGGSKSIERTLQPTSRFLGVVAAFREVELSTWRAIVEVPLNQTTAYDLELDSLSVSITPSAP